jgi:hypothetical protein
VSVTTTEVHLDTAIGGDHRRIDIGHLLLDHRAEDSLGGGQLEHRHVLGHAAHLDRHTGRDATGDRGEELAQLLRQRQQRAHFLGDHAAGLHVDRIGYELALQRQLHALGDREAGLVLCLMRRGAEVRRGHDVVELEQRRVGARLLGEHVHAHTGHATIGQGLGESLLVDEATARGVDDPHIGLDQLQFLGADQAHGLGRLRQVDGDEVAFAQQFLEAHEPHAELGGASGLDVRVISDQPGTERRDALREKHSDAAEPDHADGLALKFHAGVLGPLPLAVLQRGAGGGGVAGDRKEEGDGLLRGGHDVGRGRVDHHHTAGRGRRHLDVVQAHAGTRDHLESRGGRDRLGVDLGRAADDHGVGLGQRGKQRGAVGAVDVTHIEVVGQHIECRRGELFGDENNGSHSFGLTIGRSKTGKRRTAPHRTGYRPPHRTHARHAP